MFLIFYPLAWHCLPATFMHVLSVVVEGKKITHELAHCVTLLLQKKPTMLLIAVLCSCRWTDHVIPPQIPDLKVGSLVLANRLKPKWESVTSIRGELVYVNDRKYAEASLHATIWSPEKHSIRISSWRKSEKNFLKSFQWQIWMAALVWLTFTGILYPSNGLLLSPGALSS